MSGKYRETPRQFRNDQKKFKDSISDATDYPLKLYIYDAYQEGTNNGYSSKEDFLSIILSNTTEAPVYEISLRPSVLVDTDDFSINARWIKNITNYNQREDDIVSLIYSQERPVYQINKELDLRDNLVFFTQESIYGDLTEGEIEALVSKDIPVFELDSYDPQYDEFGVFQYATLTLKRVVSWKAKKNNENGLTFSYTQFNYYIADIQPEEVRRIKYTFKSKPILWLLNFFDGNANNIQWNITPNTKGLPKMTPFLPSKGGGTSVGFVPTWINEIGYYNANREKIYFRQSGTSYAKYDFNSSIYGKGNPNEGVYAETSGGFWTENSLDQTPVLNSIFNNKDDLNYKSMQMAFDAFVNLDDKRTEMVKAQSDTLDFSTPFNFMGYSLIETDAAATTSTFLPRPENKSTAVWETWKDTTYFYFDVSSNGNNEIAEKSIDLNYSKLEVNEPSKNDENIVNLLNGNNWTIFGETINEKPPASYTGNFDFSPNPKEWDIAEIKKYLGVFYFEEEWNIDGSNGELEMSPIIPDNLTTAESTGITTSGLFDGELFIGYGTSNNIKSRQSNRDWYLNYDENWVFEIELENQIEILTRMDQKYFGGYEYEVAFFKNSYEDAQQNGDESCTFTFIDGVEYKLPPLTYRAANRRGNPLSYGESKIYGTGGDAKSKKILLNKNTQLVKENSKKLYNVNNGKKIKNIQYKKGGA